MTTSLFTLPETARDGKAVRALVPADNKFHVGNGNDGKHYWLTPPALYGELDAEFHFTFDPCPFPKPDSFDGLTCEWGESNYVNPPFGSIIHNGKKKGPTAWVRKAIEESHQGKCVVFVYPIDKWVLMLLAEGAQVRNLGDVRWLATEDGTEGKGTGRHIACFVLEPKRGRRTPKSLPLFSRHPDQPAYWFIQRPYPAALPPRAGLIASWRWAGRRVEFCTHAEAVKLAASPSPEPARVPTEAAA